MILKRKQMTKSWDPVQTLQTILSNSSIFMSIFLMYPEAALIALNIPEFKSYFSAGN
jgi:hypothetical protein